MSKQTPEEMVQQIKFLLDLNERVNDGLKELLTNLKTIHPRILRQHNGWEEWTQSMKGIDYSSQRNSENSRL